MRILLILLLLTGVCFAQEAQDPPLNKKYSYHDFQGQVFTDAKEFNNTLIVGSGFGVHEKPYSIVFPKDMTGVRFRLCVLTNAVIPEGNIVEDSCVTGNILPMNDGEYWLVDKDLKPIEPLKKERFIKYGLSTDPKDIPKVKTKEPITVTAAKAVAQ